MGEENYRQNEGHVQRPLKQEERTFSMWLLDTAGLWVNLVCRCLFWLTDSSGKI